MSQKIRFLQVIGGILITLLLVGCSVPAASPTPIPPADTATSAPPTATTAPPTSTPTPEFPLATSIEDILGTWFGSGEHTLYHRFTPDGTCLVAVSKRRLESEPNVVCTCSFEGAQMTMACSEADGLPSCPGNGVYEVQLLPNGNIKFVKVEDSCAKRVLTMTMEYHLVP